jgi:hypothetical protein
LRAGGDSGANDAGADAAADVSTDVAIDASTDANATDSQSDGTSSSCAPAVGGTQALYVATTGADTNPGTQAQPFLTIQQAANVATPGTIVHVASGSYSACVSVKVNGAANARIAFVSDVKWGAKLDASVVTACSSAIFDIGGSYIDVVDFDIGGSSGVFLGIITRQSHARIIGNHVHDLGTTSCNGSSGGAGIDNTNYTATDNDIIDNWVNGIGAGCNTVQGIYTSQPGGHIQNNVAYDNSGYGIHCWHGCAGVTVTNNLAFNNHTGGMVFGDGDNGATSFDGSIVANNIAVFNAGYGIHETEPSGQHTIGANNVFANNLVFGNATGGILLIEGNTDSATITTDPQLVSYDPKGAGDYHLSATSPAIDTGTSSGAPPYDLDGICRPQGKGFDIGPYER